MATTPNKVYSSGDAGTGNSYQQQNPTAHPSAFQPTSYPHPANYQQTTQYPYPPGYHHQQQQHLPQPPAHHQQGLSPTYQPDQVKVVPFHTSPNDLNKSTTLAVILCVPILGMLGLHHFYLNRSFFGYLYAFTLGLFAIGWIVDWFRIKSLVKRCNDETREAQIRGYKLYSPKYPTPLTKISLCDAYLLWLPPCGLFGFYHYYLGRSHYGIYHSCTFGCCGLGWLLDFCRLPAMVRKANADIAQMKKGIRVSDPSFSVCDAYILAFPLGILGLHHFYLGNYKRGFLFLCTMGVFGLGWLADLFQMPMIVSEANKTRELKQRLTNALTNNQTCGGNTTTTVVVVPNQGYPAHPGETQSTLGGGGGGATGAPVLHEPPPAYTAHARNGESVVFGASGSGSAMTSSGPQSAGLQENAGAMARQDPAMFEAKKKGPID